MYNKNRKQQVLDLWNEGLGATQIGKKLGIDVCNVSSYLTQSLGPGNKGRHINNYRIFTLDEYFFEKIDREDKAYFLGLLYADGSLNKNQNSVTIALHEKDKEILECFRKCMNYTKPLYFKKKAKELGWNRSNQYQLEVSSKIFRKNLESYGLTPNKTFTLEFPKNLPEEFIRHFVRGYFDGDGCIHVEKKRNKPGVSFASNNKFCNDLLEVMKTHGMSGGVCKHYKNNCYYYRMWGNENILNFYNFIYDNSTIFFDRKKKIFDDWIVEKDVRKNNKLILCLYREVKNQN